MDIFADSASEDEAVAYELQRRLKIYITNIKSYYIISF